MKVLDPHTAIQLLPQALESVTHLGIKCSLLPVQPGCGEGLFPPGKLHSLFNMQMLWFLLTGSADLFIRGLLLCASLSFLSRAQIKLLLFPKQEKAGLQEPWRYGTGEGEVNAAELGRLMG